MFFIISVLCLASVTTTKGDKGPPGFYWEAPQPYTEPQGNRGPPPRGPPPDRGPPPPPPPPPRKPPPPYNSHQWNMDLVEQTKTGNKVDQCPCIKRPGSDQCITYDFRYQASTLAEAVLNFPDLTNGEMSSKDPSNPWRSVAANDSMQCSDQNCRACSAAMIHQLSLKGVINATDKARLLEDLGVSEQMLQQYPLQNCDMYRFLPPGSRGPSRSPLPSPPSVPSHIQSSLDVLKQYGRENQQNPDNRRGRRQANVVNMMGKQYIINCVKKGEPENDQTTTLGLCNICWVWRELPESYFPTYVNELICGNDTKCLSGFGGCKQRYRNLNVLRNLGTEQNPQWTPVSISSGTCCDCQIESGSPIQSLISESG